MGLYSRKRLTDRDVLALLKIGAYSVDLVTAQVVGPRKKPITPVLAKHIDWRAGKERHFVRLYTPGGYRRVIALSKLVWMAATMQVVPPNFEVHHWDEDSDNNAYSNLYCLHKKDHFKLHERNVSFAVAEF